MSFVIEIEHLKKSFGNKIVLRDVSLKINPGESYVVIGESGTGKSVLIKCILNLCEIDSGTIKINGKDLARLSQREKFSALLKCGVLFQGGALFDSLSVIDNISFGLIHGYGKSIKEAHRISIEKLGAVNLDQSIASSFPAELSGGMKKRVALARAIATDPDIIFFDEPTTGLDPITSGMINELIVKCTKEFGISAVSITHDITSIKHIGDRVGLLHDGRFIWEGTKAELLVTDNPYVRQFISGSSEGPFTGNTNSPRP
ncbi:MAG: ATP-binding cassette domain-containing protein [Holosporales bacterium]|jgi:phospholipid/cholesterol/gamma-HCH transport system ATP-binding protein|nr:ATP-binding cassette domain-containing protein [Holosporales bacterium]